MSLYGHFNEALFSFCVIVLVLHYCAVDVSLSHSVDQTRNVNSHVIQRL